MDVRVTHHIDKGEQGPDGLYDYYYEYDLIELDFGDGRVARARRYVEEEQDSVSILGVEDTKKPGGFEMFYDAPEAAQIVSNLRKRGFGKIRVLDKTGYEPLDLSRVKDVQ
jgi:hypothetical protein